VRAQSAGQIAVLKEGQVAEVGSHEELMERPESAYRQLVTGQDTVTLLTL
jgi:ABC-type multidrug transport system fused ATPase/permease subunit